VLQLKVERSLLTDAEKSFLVQRLHIVSDQVQRASDIVEALRGFTRRGTVLQVSSDLERIFQRVFGLMEQQFIMRSIEVQVTYDNQRQPIFGGVEVIERVIVQGLAFSRDAVSALGDWYAVKGRPHEKKLSINLGEQDGNSTISFHWGTPDEGSDTYTISDPWSHTGLATAASVLRADGGSFVVAEDGLTIVFPQTMGHHR
jgi:hypothetical protein